MRIASTSATQSRSRTPSPLYGVKGGGICCAYLAGTGIQKAYNGAIGYTLVWSPTLL